MIQNVEQLAAELEIDPLSQVSHLQDGKVKLGETRSDEDVAPDITVSAGGRWKKRGIPLGSGAASPSGTAAVRIDTTSSRFALEDFAFDFNSQTGAAAIRIEYSYPPARAFGDETYRDPGTRIATLPGLIYDRSAHEVVYEADAKKTACAVEVSQRVLLWKRPRLKNTGACLVTARVSHHAEANGWTTSGFDTLDTYFEVCGH
jgi:hypothetical protein